VRVASAGTSENFLTLLLSADALAPSHQADTCQADKRHTSGYRQRNETALDETKEAREPVDFEADPENRQNVVKKRGRCSQTCQFVYRLYDLLTNASEHPTDRETVRFSEDGTYFTVFNRIAFQKDILLKYYRTNKMRSFTRQLNVYGFRSSTSGGTARYVHFSHPLFARGVDQAALDRITRRRHPLEPSERQRPGPKRITDQEDFLRLSKSRLSRSPSAEDEDDGPLHEPPALSRFGPSPEDRRLLAEDDSDSGPPAQSELAPSEFLLSNFPKPLLSQSLGETEDGDFFQDYPARACRRVRL